MQKEHKFFRYWRLIYPLGFYFIMTNIVALLAMVGIATVYTVKNPLLSPAVLAQMMYDSYMEQLLLITFLSGLVTLPFLIIFMRADTSRKKKAGTWKKYERAPLWGYGVLVLLGGFACLGLNNLIAVSGLMQIFDDYSEIAEFLYQSNIPFEILATGILIPVVEELLFRGLIFRRAREYFNFPVALVFSAAMFGIYHGNIVQGIYAFILGLIFGYTCERFKSVWAPIILHSSANCLSVILSETEIFTPIYENVGVFFLITAISIIIVICLLLLIEQKINLKEVEN